jgi:hypothetical protein
MMNFSVAISENGTDFERVLFDGKNICKVKYHFKYWLEAKGMGRTVSFDNFVKDAVLGVIPGIGKASIKYFSGKSLRIKFSFKAENDISIGFYFLGIEFPDDTSSLRLLPGVYSGYSKDRKTFIFDSVYNESAGLYQLALAVDQLKTSLGTTLQEHQWLTMSFPPSYKDGVADLKAGQEISGELVASMEREDIWNPIHTKRKLEKSPAPKEFAPKFSWQKYLENWEKYAQIEDLWVSLGDKMGMFHVGFYNLLKEPKLGGPFGYTLNDKKIRYKDVYDVAFGKRAEENIKLSYFQDNTKQLEIGWGNGCNVMVAYSFYHYGGEFFQEKADETVHAVLNFKEKGRGFQLMEGPLKGAWINSYDADKKRFQDHYGGEQIFMPDQGIVNYFLGKIFLEGFNQDPKIIDVIKINCEDFLLEVEKKTGTFPNAFSQDGSEGYSREGYLYDKPNAPGVAQAALSLVILYELTRDSQYLAQAERIIKTHLKPLIDANRFGFLEYDHLGWCSAGACSILISLAEYLELEDGMLKELVKEMQGKVFYHLLSFRHEHDYFVYEHAENVDNWGAKSVTENGFLHGFTPNSGQGEYMLHTRYEYGYALMRTYQTKKCDLTKSAWVNHLNYLTWQQFTNPDLKKGFGGITEHTGLRTYIQDTTHLVHSTPLPLILADKFELAIPRL